MLKKNVAIIGGGPASLMLACSLDANKFNISIYEKNAALGRKFLVAGKGGFNLTHSENIQQFADRYYPKIFIEPFLNRFSNTDFRNWLKSIGIETYVGTSKRVFPVKGIKPIEVLKAIEEELHKNQVQLFSNHLWQGWQGTDLLFSVNNDSINIKTDITVFALGGASWKVTGSDGNWTEYFNSKGIKTTPFYPSNCAYQIKWNIDFIKAHHGSALKNCEFTCGSIRKKGEAIITQFGIEGSGIYPLSPEIRKQLINNKAAEIFIDFKPDLSLELIKVQLENRGKLSIKDVLEKKLHLSAVQIALIKTASDKEQYNDVDFLSNLIKNYPISIIDFAPIDDAISTVGGIPLNEINENLELLKLPNHYCIGEMLDWDAPTGGYLLQACFSMGKFLADKLNSVL
ncbi:MAG: TIGR03862 family flavoprotein [Burkholderiales bacterium]|nr:TIGR03862 family flavoprotein [Bacteroidia bacterium]